MLMNTYFIIQLSGGEDDDDNDEDDIDALATVLILLPGISIHVFILLFIPKLRSII